MTTKERLAALATGTGPTAKVSVSASDLGKLTDEVAEQTAGEIRKAIKAAAPAAPMVTGEQLATWCQSERPEPSKPAPAKSKAKRGKPAKSAGQ